EKEEKEANNLPIFIRQEDIFDQTEKDLNKMIKMWQEGLSKIVFNKLLESLFDLGKSAENGSFKNWMSKFSKLMFNLFGKKFTDIKKYDNDISYRDFLKLFKNTLFTEKKVTVFIDDLDRGWSNQEHEIKNISALLNALRTITREIPNIKFRIALRSSVYFAVRTSDESTDKIENSIVWLKWNNHEILAMLAKRIIFFKNKISLDEKRLLKLSQYELAKNFKGVFEMQFKGEGHWNNAPIHRVVLSLIRQRPRDLVKLCSLAAQEAFNNGHQKILTGDFQNVFQRYSQERLTDTVNEYNSELRELQKVLLEMKPDARNSKVQFQYTPQDLSIKMKKVIEHVGKMRFSNGELVTERKLAAFLYKINFFTARKDTKDKEIVRYYYDENKYAFNEDIDNGFNVEVHPAYRWALQPQDIFGVYKSIELIG
ncbi:MAG: hypothetical protein J6K39_00835, partial [Clostridia bacterium]|nr:hypothetical protein [Clostridia bacterium]